ncbi:Hypothetical_protein [Hexamita inflata]|uniref:Hypothetical_protein n=1 Tax=Hexamita inflata TaxID=28002 RepID=A0AA86UUS1_9EUKA|nr:Hypothetical protein HINF_LOCUS53267 [Hexamita inflata]
MTTDFVQSAKQCLFDLTRYDIDNISETLLLTSILCLQEPVYNRFLLEMSYHLNLPVNAIQAHLFTLSNIYLTNISLISTNSNSFTSLSSFSSHIDFEFVFPQIFLMVVEEITNIKMNSIYGALNFQLQKENYFFWKLVQKRIPEFTEAQLKTYYYKLCELQTENLKM